MNVLEIHDAPAGRSAWTTVVVPATGGGGPAQLLAALAAQSLTVRAPIIVVDDRPGSAEAAGTSPVDVAAWRERGLDVLVVSSGGRGAAHARNIGWRHAETEWVTFLDEDLLPDRDWYETLHRDLEAARGLDATVGRVRVPLPEGRRPTDWERTAALSAKRWITADLSCPRATLSALGGFDERFPRGFREGTELALRITERRDDSIMAGERWVSHLVAPGGDWSSVRQQVDRADDALMRRLHGPDWRSRAGGADAPRPGHLLITAAGVLGIGGALARRGAVTAAGAAIWAAGTAELAWQRISRGPRDRQEVRRMLLTSMAIPPAATLHTARGAIEHRHAAPWKGVPDLVLLDGDDMLVRRAPHNADPDQVEILPGAREALDRLRTEGIRVALVSNRCGIARGRVTVEQVTAVAARIEELLGPFAGFFICPHGPDEGCVCRKPQPGLIKEALADADVDPSRAVMVGDLGGDVEAAAAAGVPSVLVPTQHTRRQAIEAAPVVARSLGDAVDALLAGAC